MPEDVRQEDQAQKICEGLEDLTIELRGWSFTEQQWNDIRLAWVHFAETLAPCRPPKEHKRTLEYKNGEILESKDDDFDRAMELLK